MTIEAILSGLSASEKLAAMDFLWKDLSKSSTGFESPEWHERVLLERVANPSPEPSLPLEEAIVNVRERLNARKTSE